jgi:hypothetical protein
MSEFASALNPAAEFEYNARVRELFASLTHAGSLPGAIFVGVVREPPFVNDEEGGSWVNHSRWSRTAPTKMNAVLCAAAGTREQGASIQLYVDVRDARLHTARYLAYGCPHFLAACESLAQWLEGRAVGELTHWRWRDVEIELAVPASKRARLLLLDEAIATLIGS